MPRKRFTFWTIDAETDPFHNCDDLQCEKCHGGGRVPAPFLYGVYNGDSETYLEFRTTAELSNFFTELERDSGGTLFYAHNGGKFDYHFFKDLFNSDEPILIINGRMAKFHIGAHEFRDSLNIFPNTRLKDFGIKSDIAYEKMEAAVREIHMKEISAYLRQDCKGLWDVVKQYFQTYGKQMTQAGASMKVWQKMSGLEAPRQTKSQYEALKPFYYGGRVQCMRGISEVRNVDFEVYDINSAYPFAMLHTHPLSPTFNISGKLPDDKDIGPCLIRLECVSTNGALPLREDLDLKFPVTDERREYFITGWEFLAALETNAISKIKIHDVYKFNQTVSFKEYIEHFFALREEARKAGDVAGRTFGKYFMNSLYGKFGANCENYADYLIASPENEPEHIAKGYTIYKPWGSRNLMVRKPTNEELDDINGKWRYYNIATAASVTGFVRAYLYRAMCAASGVIYCDTDSIAAEKFGNLNTGAQLGAWKHEMTCDRYAIAGKKMYAFHKKGAPLDYDPEAKDGNWKIASKGVNFGARKNGPEMIEKIARGETILFKPEAPTFTVTRPEPTFIDRYVSATAKDMTKIGLAKQPA
jgi:hypothetical protein